jgi:phosphohistidine phosphatase
MLVILFRHGIAAPLETHDGTDFDRPLTPDGRDRTTRAAIGLAAQIPKPDCIVSSPKLRAMQTAQCLREALGRTAPNVTEWPELMHDDFVPLISRLRHLAEQGTKTVACAGHEPNLSHFAVQVLTGYADAFDLEIKKAGAVALAIEFEPLNAKLLWQLTPKQLRELGRRAS